MASTQDEARRLARAGGCELVVVADEQTGGHGRRGRSWTSPPGNLYATVVTAPRFAPAFVPAGSLIAATALCRAIEQLSPTPPPLSVKWPNDVLLDGRKLAGLLLEVAGEAVLIGCGVNLRAAPPAFPDAATLAGRGLDVQAPVVLERWLSAWRRAAAALAEGDTASWRDAWLARAAGLNRPIRVTLPERRLEGVHRGIDAYGALRVETAGGVESVLAGDVELVRLGETF
ncbi:MAG: biotin--[acetyl-CoA-carboxylase] ligase [Alphaproteobacteria bacterium]|nr:biotin--[acetyl-CoA-carboxylase] ligase [Alphaproteobacteria bacterium]